MYSGETLLVQVRAHDPRTHQPLGHSKITFRAYAPGKDPRASAEDRADPDATVELDYDIETRSFLGQLETTGWPAGQWSALAELTGQITGTEYHEFEIAPALP